ncbi:type II toxin-antitoxin system RelE/ParE family toxin [Mariprofundus sp. NF]|uniref:type II toxin-antitoxin system RelE/ParE family toxin n=1 Tax=Mariprofundus sp. NF TaxID=2608716 RepID=UPI00159F741D|nr:type II toxin-antitoxin system RelE/ParE family toxin [Mariprofundus sp. NF]
MKQLDHCFHLLNRSPEIGRVRTEIASELSSHPSGSHIIYYLTKADHIVIVDILHQNMDPVRHLPSQQ